ncbi:hypothetical protein ES703_121224 [subsurface metagenome]
MSHLRSTKADIDLRNIVHIHGSQRSTGVLQVNIPLMPRFLFYVVHIGVFHDAIIAVSIFHSHIHLVLMNTTNNTRSVVKIISMAIEVQHQCFNTAGSPIRADFQISSTRFGLATGKLASDFEVPEVIPHRPTRTNESRLGLNEKFRTVSGLWVVIIIFPNGPQSRIGPVRVHIVHGKKHACSKPPEVSRPFWPT